MADDMETTVTDEAGSEAGIVDQGSDFDAELLSQDDPRAAELERGRQPTKGKGEAQGAQQKTEKPENNEQKQDKGQQAQGKQAQQQGGQQQAQQAAKASDLDEMLFGQGGFSLDKYNQAFGGERPKIGAPVLPIDQPKPGEQPKPVETPEQRFQKRMDERKTYYTGLHGNMRRGLEIYSQARQQGLNEQQAMQEAERQLYGLLQEHMMQRDFETQEKERQELAKSQETALSDARLEPQGKANLNQIATEFGGWQRLNKLLTHSELAGPYLAMLFERDNTGKKFTAADYGAALDRWLISTAAKSPDFVRHIAMYGMNAWQVKYAKQIQSQIGKKAEASALQQKRGRSNAPRTVVDDDSEAKPDSLKTFFIQPGARMESQDG